jgi:hypothetical protein
VLHSKGFLCLNCFAIFVTQSLPIIIFVNDNIFEGFDSEIIHFYNQRGEDSENRIKELKNDFGARQMPCASSG